MPTPLPTPAEMSAWDRAAIQDYGLPADLLMENAGGAALDVLRQAYGPLSGAKVLLVAGGGNNGGDAFVLARRLLDRGAEVLVLHTHAKARHSAEARLHWNIAERAGVGFRRLPLDRPERVEPMLDRAISGFGVPDILVDGLFGTGFTGELKPGAKELVRSMNALAEVCFTLALDTPSGLDGETGLPRPEAVRADATVCFHAAKLGTAMPQASTHTGDLFVRDIGIPLAVMNAAPPGQYLMDDSLLELLTAPPPDLHKGRAGHVLVLGGSEGLTGAAQLAALGALRAGAGLVTVACPRGVLPEVKAGHPDFMALPLGPEGARAWSPACMDALAPLLGRYDGVALGPGLGRDAGAAQFVALFPAAFAQAHAKGWAPPCVYDADALFHLAQAPALLATLPPSSVLTPHPGEMARLLGMGMGELQADRVAAARRFTDRHPQILVLKGAGTLVGQGGVGQGRELHLCPVSAPNLAVGGSGDVLAGLMAALLARGLPPLRAACLGVYWHAVSGLSLAKEFPGRGNLASEIANALPSIHKERAAC